MLNDYWKAFEEGFRQAVRDYFAPLVWVKNKLTSPRVIKLDDGVIERNQLSHIDTSEIEQLRVKVYMKDGTCYNATNLNAIELLMQVCPSAFEGFKFKYHRYVWVIHNLIGHPLMQLFALLRMYGVAFWIHNVTVPRPIGKKDEQGRSEK